MDAVPPKISPPAPANRLPLFISLGVALVIAATVFLFNPATNHFYPVCQFHRLTGWNCPGCGMTRAAYALLHGQFSTALHDNALFVFALIGLAMRAGWFDFQRRRGRVNGEFFPANFLWPLLAAMLVFTVLRNLPAFAFLSP
jgi:Protein of unknown function (DUF2752)